MNVSASELEGLKMLPGMTGHLPDQSVFGTQSISRFAFIQMLTRSLSNGTDAPGVLERHWVAAAHSELLRHRDKVREIDIIGPPSTQMIARVATLHSPYSGLVSARATRFNRASSRSIRRPRGGRTAGTDLFRVGDAMSEPWVHRRSVP